MADVKNIKGLLFDLDGTVYRGEAPIPGAARFIADYKDQGGKVLFVTNRANRRTSVVTAHLQELGIPCVDEEIVTSAHAAAHVIGSSSVYPIGEDGLLEALEEKGATITDNGAEWVAVGYDRQVTYEKIEKATRLILGGAKFLATNRDPVITLEDGISPENGPFIAALEYATGQPPLNVGKPERTIVDLGFEKLGLPADQVAMIGDNIDTDILAAGKAGLSSIMILTGVSTRGDIPGAGHKPDWVAEDYDDLTRQMLDF